MRSTRTRLNTSDHVSSAADAHPCGDGRRGERVGVGLACTINCGEEVDAGETLERLCHSQALRRNEGIGAAPPPCQRARPGGFGGQRQDLGAVPHDHFVSLIRSIPFEQRELRVVQGAALAVAEHAGDIDDAPFAGRKQFFAGELRRGVQIKLRARPVRPKKVGREGVQMRLVAGRDLQRRRFDLDEVARGEKSPHGRQDAVASDEKRPPVGVDVRRPPGGCVKGGAWHRALAGREDAETGEPPQDELGAPQSFLAERAATGPRRRRLSQKERTP